MVPDVSERLRSEVTDDSIDGGAADSPIDKCYRGGGAVIKYGFLCHSRTAEGCERANQRRCSPMTHSPWLLKGLSLSEFEEFRDGSVLGSGGAQILHAQEIADIAAAATLRITPF